MLLFLLFFSNRDNLVVHQFAVPATYAAEVAK